MNTTQQETIVESPAESDPIGWLDFQLRRWHQEEGGNRQFDLLTRGLRISQLLPKLGLVYSRPWQLRYPTVHEFSSEFNRCMHSAPRFYGHAHLVVDTPNAFRNSEKLRFRSIV
jgi:hypothetical protein